MRSYIPGFEMEVARTLETALDRIAEEPNTWKPFAGGTDLMVLLEAGKLPPGKYLSIWELPELRGIEVNAEHIILGATTTYTQVRKHPTLAAEFPLLCNAAAETGSIATQNRGTLGGNIVNASPAADSPPALLVYEADLELVSARGSRWVAYKDFHIGYKRTILTSDELVRKIRLHRGTMEWRQHYRKVGTRRAQAISKVCFAGAARTALGKIATVRIAMGSIAPTVIRAKATEDVLTGSTLSSSLVSEARKTLASEIAPIDDMRSTARYRRFVAQNLLAEFLEKVSS